jgi:hypothetical protein
MFIRCTVSKRRKLWRELSTAAADARNTPRKERATPHCYFRLLSNLFVVEGLE